MTKSIGSACAAGLAATALCLGAATAHGGEVLVVGPSGAERIDDPFVPSRASTKLGPSPRVFRRARAAAASSSAPRARQSRVSREVRKRRRAERLRALRSRRAVRGALQTALRKGAIDEDGYKEYRRQYNRARAVTKRLKGARKRELAGVVAIVEGMALRRQLTASRLPAVFLILHRNTQFWPRQPFPLNRDRVSFKGSRLLFEYYSGTGLQLQPLVNFKQANLMHGACVKGTGETCDRQGLKELLEELIATSSRRSGFTAWEYYFPFGGGSPPWVSGMAQATAIQALARASDLLGDDELLKHARAAFRGFRIAPPGGVRTTGPLGGTHYLQYSFAPRLYIINAFLQSLIGLYDYAQITGDQAARRLFLAAEPEARRELPRNDTGDWSTYSFGGAESTREYHELLREFSASLCNRLREKVYCDTARRFREYATEPAELELLGPLNVTKGIATQVRFSLSKLSAVQITITRNGKLALDRTAAFRRGGGSFTWVPRSAGTYTVRLAAKELRTGAELRTRVSGKIESSKP